MRNKTFVSAFSVVAVLSLAVVLAPALRSQGPEMQERLAALKQMLAFNKQVIAQYTWMEQQIISIKGEQKKEELYNVQVGPDGKPQKSRSALRGLPAQDQRIRDARFIRWLREQNA